MYKIRLHYGIVTRTLCAVRMTMYLRYSRAPKNSRMHAPRDESGAHFFFDSTLCLSGYCLHVERDGCRTSLNGRETKEQQRVGGC